MLSPLVQAGALQNSQSPIDTKGAVMDQHGTLRDPPLVNFAHFQKVNASERAAAYSSLG